MIRSLLICIILLWSKVVFGQTQPDTTQVLTFDAFYQLVLEHHPIVKQADLLPLNARQQLRLARGGFDPKLEGKWAFKEFKGTEYYNIVNGSLKVPTWFPIDPKIEIDRNTGLFLNPERSIPDDTNNRQVFIGFSLPIGKGLVIDERRAVFKQALIFQDMADVEQIKAINKILLKAAKDYWDWFYAYNNFLLMQQSVGIANDIFSRTLSAFTYGEVAAIDTVQAKITLLKRRLEAQEAANENVKAGLKLSNHLWSADGIPLELSGPVAPQEVNQQEITVQKLTELLELARTNHPELRKLDLKNRSLAVDKALTKESLKPQLDITYGFIDQPLNPQGEGNGLDFRDNVKAGIDFSFPLFLRKERSKIKQIEYKIAGNNYKRSFQSQKIVNEINGVYNTLITTRQMMGQQQEVVDSYQLIVAAEQLNLQNGESDLFKINLQVEKLIESQTKLLKLDAKYQKQIVELYWAAGISNLGFR